MRQVKDMNSSLISSVLVHAGLLLAVFGFASALSNAQPIMAMVGVAGLAALVAGIITRKPSQVVAYRAYLKAQETSDLTQAVDKKWMDEESVEAIKEEIAERK